MSALDAGQQAQLLALYPILTSLAVAARSRLLESIQLMRLPAGTVLFDERQACQGFPLILEGAVRVVKASSSGRELPLYRVTPGETCVITTSCLVGKADYTARGMAESDLVLVFLPAPVFSSLLVEPAFRDFVFHLFSARIAELMQLVEEVAFKKLDQRLAALLLGKGRIVHATHQQLADELGSVREIVSRLLKGFATQGLVSLGREQIEILEAAGLRQIAGR
ncbi:MAG: Crp/Fnr family transcriptional regulator [Rhodocyclaceae bacterium]|nr:Crp/Fnr family transcriptional regulator [Rhodocyclaceae bacterium]